MKYGLIGEKLGHSFSRTIHEMLSDNLYELREIPKDELDGFMKSKSFSGINVTIPYKESVIPYLDEIDEGAREIGAVNAIVNRCGKLIGYNTDFYGMQKLFLHAGIDAKGKRAAILGSGGTSRTAMAVLRSLGADEILRVSRSGKDGNITYDELYSRHSDIEIIVNTTPMGMFPNIDGAAVDVSKFENLSGVIDAVYNPIRTQLVLDAMAKGIAAEGGLYMLVAQAVRASEIFLDTNYSEDIIEKIYRKINGEKESIVLIGMPACGKSTVGKILAKKTGRTLVDTDELIVKKVGMEITEIFRQYGEDKFRDIESEVIAEISGNGSLIIATGGGAILRDKNVRSLKKNGRLYFIDRPLDALVPTDSRPLSSDRTAIEKRYEERYGIYSSVCDKKIDADCDAETVAEKILENF
ncbi:MAG: shikimate dehydrogenase [Clostridia bacterium]|nr:shikimate dehydrogenase [Clostridia bacterium]